MIDPAIDEFFTRRKEAWLKANVKPTMEESEVTKLQKKCAEIFSLEAWLPLAAKRAGQMSLATHPCTFSHPSARKNKNGYATPVFVAAKNRADGYLRTGNTNVEVDALGNAAALAIYKFLTLKMKDSKKLIDHIQSDSPIAIELLTIPTEKYETLKNGFMAMLESGDDTKIITSSKIKQVYFPVQNGYHQLSLLSNSGIIFKLKNRIDLMTYSDAAKEFRKKERNNEYSDQCYSKIYGLTAIGFGGTKPQNVSVLNNKNGGKAYLLMSMPPALQNRTIRFPKNNFFDESLRDFEYRKIFNSLQRLFKANLNNKRIRDSRDNRLHELMTLIIARMWAVRAVYEEQYRSEYSYLEPHQKIWLCEDFCHIREKDDVWLDTLCNEITAWFFQTYERLHGKKAFRFGDAEKLHVRKIVIEHKESLR